MHQVSYGQSGKAPSSAYPQAVVRIELHVLVEEFCDFGEVVLHLLVGVGVRCAAQHCVAHDGSFNSIEEAEEDDTRHLVLRVGVGKKLGGGGGKISE